MPREEYDTVGVRYTATGKIYTFRVPVGAKIDVGNILAYREDSEWRVVTVAEVHKERRDNGHMNYKCLTRRLTLIEEGEKLEATS